MAVLTLVEMVLTCIWGPTSIAEGDDCQAGGRVLIAQCAGQWERLRYASLTGYERAAQSADPADR